MKCNFLKEKIKTTWNSANKQWLIDRGYIFTKIYDEVYIWMKDVQPTSNIKVKFYCERCGCVVEKARREIRHGLCRRCNMKMVAEARQLKRKRCVECGKYVDRPKDYVLCKECRNKKNDERKNNIIEVLEDRALIYLEDRNGEVTGVAIIDVEDVDKVREYGYRWRLSGGYAYGKNSLKLHRFIMDCYDGSKVVDHINKNGLDNRKRNLRVVEQKINCSNRSVSSLRYAKITTMDFCQYEGISTAIWVTGCPFNCKNCANKDIQDRNTGKLFTEDTYNELKGYLSDPFIDNLVLLGGEPFYNATALLPIVRRLKVEVPDKTIVSFSGFTIEEIMEGSTDMVELLKELDVLIDGRFVEELSKPRPLYRGSSNQRIIDVQRTLAEGKIIIKKVK